MSAWFLDSEPSTCFLLNQARAGCRPACTWFLEIVSSTNVGVCACVCVSSPEAINNKSRERHA